VTLDFFASLVAFLLTMMVLSYLIDDNPLFRLAVALFIGISAGYVAAVAWWQVLWPDLMVPLVTGSALTRVSLVVPLVLCGLLLMKGWPPMSRLGMPAMGVIVGAAAAAAVGGAVSGTLFPQFSATLGGFGAQSLENPELLINAVLVLVGVVSTLAYFQFGARVRADGTVRRIALVEVIASVGGIFLAITLGVLFAGVYSASLTALIERMHFVATFLGGG
jgi:hypothetical protein